MTGFATASLITLSSHVKLSLTFALSTFGVQFVLLACLQLSGRMPFDYPLLTVFFVFACFVVRQAYDLRAHMIARFRSEIRMEISNALLRESRQRELEQTAQTVHASRLASLGEMAGGIAHEINNPLAIISTSLEVMELGMQRAGITAPEASAEAMARIHRAIARIARIVRGLRKLSRTSEQDAKEETTMSRVLTDTMDLCTEKFLSHQIRFEARGFEEEVRIPCRPIEVSQILINLLNNAFDAVKSLPEKDRVITLTQSVREREICLRVENGGPRIGEWGKSRLFQPFFTTKEVGLGTGLGLSISRALAINHQGTLEFDDTAEQTSFVLTLPRS
jgi:C4-dicarboxylate-specific signal transduction histidine kinase